MVDTFGEKIATVFFFNYMIIVITAERHPQRDICLPTKVALRTGLALIASSGFVQSLPSRWSTLWVVCSRCVFRYAAATRELFVPSAIYSVNNVSPNQVFLWSMALTLVILFILFLEITFKVLLSCVTRWYQV